MKQNSSSSVLKFIFSTQTAKLFINFNFCIGKIVKISRQIFSLTTSAKYFPWQKSCSASSKIKFWQTLFYSAKRIFVSVEVE